MKERTLFDAAPEPKLARDTDKATSHAAAAETQQKLSLTKTRCLEPMVWTGKPMTANEIAANAVLLFRGGMAESYRKRVHELANAGFLRECGSRVCSITGKGATCYERVR